MMTIDREPPAEAFAPLAALVAAVRPDWDPPGIRAGLLAAVRRPKVVTFPEFTRAILTIALDPTSRTPARLAHEHPAWDTAVVANTAPKIRPLTPDRCRVCLQPPHPPRPNDHTYEPHEPPTTGGSPR